jgi:formylglycine-generating enzyme required for sulfatase activity
MLNLQGISVSIQIMKKIAIIILLISPFMVYADGAVSEITSNMVYVEGGSFQMGEETPHDDIPVHTVVLSSYYINRFETINRAAAAVFNYGISRGYVFVQDQRLKITIDGWTIFLLNLNSDFCMIEYNNGILTPVTGMEDYPVVGISWYGAAVYCNILSEMNGYEKCYDLADFSCDLTKNGFRLPTEAEWEFAAGGGINRDGNFLSDKQESEMNQWYDDEKPEGPLPAGSMYTNSLGICDMLGNVRELCNDLYDEDYYMNSAQVNPAGPEYKGYEYTNDGYRIQSQRVVRGSYYLDRFWVEAFIKNRYPQYASEDIPSVGFRIVRNSE